MSWRRSPKPTSRQRPADAKSARVAAVALLARRDFASGELCARLRGKGFDAATVVAVSAELTDSGILSDARYAQNYVTYHAGRGHGPIRIAAELRRHGVPALLIEDALSGGPDWRALALKVCRGKFGPQAPVSWPQKARQARFLQYRGFSTDHIRAATAVDPETD